jgi:hypothetical protein
VALGLEGFGFPPDFARVGDDAGADAEVFRVADDDAGGEEVELDAAGGVTGVGAAVDLEDDGDGLGRAAKFVGDLGDEAAFAFVSEGDTDIGDQLAGKREE